MEKLPLHWRQRAFPLKGQYGQMNYYLWRLGRQRHAVGKACFQFFWIYSDPVLLWVPFFFWRMADMPSLNSCRYAAAFFSRAACWKPKNSLKEGWVRLCQVEVTWVSFMKTHIQMCVTYSNVQLHSAALSVPPCLKGQFETSYQDGKQMTWSYFTP